MTVRRLYTPDIYRKIMAAPADKRDDIFRHELMKPFEGKWNCYHIPLKAHQPGGYDIVMACRMMGLMTPGKMTPEVSSGIDAISDMKLWDTFDRSIEEALMRFACHGIEPKVQDYLYSVLLADPDNAYTVMNEGYCGDGGIPGYIMAWLVPSDETIRRLPAALAHETDHNIRYQFIKWTDDITLGEMLVSEGLAENFAVSIYGEGSLGPWVTRTDPELIPHIKSVIREGLHLTGLPDITSYLYGDEMARMQHYPEAGLPYCAGYATGYYLIRYYLEKTGIPIEEATILPADEILSQTEGFWSIC